MRKLLIMLAVLVIDVGNEEFPSEARPCECTCKTASCEKTVIVPEENTLLIRLQS